MTSVVVLNASYEVLSRVPLRRAVRYVFREQVEILHATPPGTGPPWRR